MSARPCAWRTVHECRGEIHPYLAGWLCEAGAPPKQPRPPTPPPARRIVSAPAYTVLDDRAIASGKRRSNPAAYRAARDAEQQRRTPRA